MTRATIFTLFVFCAITFRSTAVIGAPADTHRPGFETAHFSLRLIPRTPNQIAAFYTGRGFPPAATELLRQRCFITLGLRNKGREIVWLDLSNWQFKTSQGVLRRDMRQDWATRWAQLGLEKRFQSTFRWTLMPEKLDFRPFESEGGNIILPRTGKPITITASIAVGKPKTKVYPVRIENVMCANDP